MAKDYWRKNLATYRDAKLPDITHVELDLELFPESSRLSRLRHLRPGQPRGHASSRDPPDRRARTGRPLLDVRRQALRARRTAQRLYIFTPPLPLGRGQTARIGFRHEGTFPRGISKKGGAAMEFILPSGVVLTSFRPSFVPILGFSERGRHRGRQSLRGQGIRRRLLQGSRPTRCWGPGPRSRPGSRSPGPPISRSTRWGSRPRTKVEGNRRTVVWESDHPVSFFNVVAGRWNVKRGEGAAVYYDPGHPYNVDEMLQSLDAARKYFSAWFHPLPVEGAEAQRVPQPGHLRAGIPDQHHVLRGYRLPDQGQPRDPRRVRDHRARGRAPVVGQHGDARQGARAATSCPKGRPTSRRSSWSSR